MNSPRKNNHFVWVVIIVVLIFALVIYAGTFGKVDYVTGDAIDSFKEKRRLALLRHKKLSALISKKVELKRKLDRRFKLAYNTLTFVGICLFFGANAGVYFYNNLDISTILTWNTAVWFPFGIVNTVYFGSRISLKSALQYFKTALENKMYAKYVNIGDQIDTHEKELEELEKIFKADNVASQIKTPSSPVV